MFSNVFNKKSQEIDTNNNHNNPVVNDFEEFDIEYKSLGCGVHNNKYYFTVAGNEKKIFLVSSDKKMYCDDYTKNGRKAIQEDFGIRYRHKFLHEIIEKRWSKESIKKWMTSDVKVNIKDLFYDIKKLFKKYIDHPDDRVIDYFVTDVICSYFMPLFQTKGRTVIYAPPASGKTRTLTIFALLCLNAKIMDKSSSIASMYRFIQNTGGTIIRDNMDREGDSLKEFLDILETGYKKGTSSVKCTGRNFQLEAFETFSHVIYANISGLSDTTTITRCNLIELVKTDNKEITINEINASDEEWQTAKDNLFIYAMNEWKEVKFAYENFKEDKFYSRELEKLKANLVIAKLVSEEIYKDMIKCFKEIEENQKIIDFFDNKLYHACEYINLMLKESNTGEIKFKIKEIAKFLVHKEIISKDDERNTSQYLGRIFSNHSRFFKKGYLGKNVSYAANYDSFKKFVKSHGFEKVFEQDTESPESILDAIEETDV